MVFAYLAEKGLFRIGFDLTCPTCRLRSWVSLDDVKQHVVCELCGASHDATRQLIDGDLRYRRTGVLGLEKNTQGAVPVALVLEQLTRNVSGAFREGIYGPSYDLYDLEAMEGKKQPKCETDFIMIIPERYPERTSIIIGECKDGKDIDHKDVENLREVADAFPRERFRVFITLAKLSAFKPAEIELAKSLNDKYRQRAILLTASELEPYRIYDRASEEFKKRFHGTSAQELAVATAAMYFNEPSATAGMV